MSFLYFLLLLRKRGKEKKGKGSNVDKVIDTILYHLTFYLQC